MTTKNSTNITPNTSNYEPTNLPTFSFDFESVELARLTTTIAQAEAAGARMKLIACNALAAVRDMGDDALIANGFKGGFTDYARSMFGYSKSNAYDMVNVAERFDIDEHGNIGALPELTGLGWTALLALKGQTDEQIQSYIADGKLNASTSVRAVKALVAPKREKTSKTKEPITVEHTKNTKDTKDTKDTNVVKAATRSKDFKIVPFKVIVRDGYITFSEGDDNTNVVQFDATNSLSAAVAVNKFKTMLGF